MSTELLENAFYYNGTIKAIVTIDVGPRIISFSRCDAEEEGNIFLKILSASTAQKEKISTSSMEKAPATLPMAVIVSGSARRITPTPVTRTTGRWSTP